MAQECPKELRDLSEVQGFYVSLLEPCLGHSVLVPAEVKEALNSPTDPPEGINALKFWLDLLDMAITPPMIRESLKRESKSETAHSLLRYLVGKASSRSSDRDKCDCVITFLFRGPCSEPSKQWQRPEIDTSYHHLSLAALTFEGDIYRGLGDVHFEPMPAAQVQLLSEFEYFHQELEEFRRFDQITDSAMVQRVRELKQSLGKSFYHPDALAAIAVWNDVFGRKFDELFHDATKQIKTFAEHVTREGGSILSRVEGDITVQQLTEIKTQQILAEDYQNAQDQFRRVSKFKKAVDHRKVARPGAPIPPLAPPAAIANPGAPPSAAASAIGSVAQPAPAPQPPPAPPRIQERQEAEVIAVAPSAAVHNAVQEGKIHSTKETIKNHVRSAETKFTNLVPIKKNNMTLSAAEVEAFRVDYGGEKSFRADYANILMLLVSYHARMIIEVDDYRQKSNSAYLWKPHADALGYLLSTFERLSLEAEQLRRTARQRGLQDKATAVEATLDKVKKYAQTVSETLHAADHSFTS
ncbi:MAG TPA: hypothetical protein VI685_00905 [Candidatus Angelobacter sp.]